MSGRLTGSAWSSGSALRQRSAEDAGEEAAADRRAADQTPEAKGGAGGGQDTAGAPGQQVEWRV